MIRHGGNPLKYFSVQRYAFILTFSWFVHGIHPSQSCYGEWIASVVSLLRNDSIILFIQLLNLQ